jgi:hypothetical protein
MVEVLSASNITHLVCVELNAFGIAITRAKQADFTVPSVGGSHLDIAFVWHVGRLRIDSNQHFGSIIHGAASTYICILVLEIVVDGVDERSNALVTTTMKRGHSCGHRMVASC